MRSRSMRTAAALRLPLAVAAWPGLARAHFAGDGAVGPPYGSARDVVRLTFADVEPSGARSPGPGEEGLLQSQETRLSASVPVYGQGTDAAWFVGVFGERLNLHFTGFAPAVAPALVTDLYGTGVHGGVFHRLRDDRAVFAYPAAGAFSDG